METTTNKNVNMTSVKPKVACFGEVLWDIFPGNNPRAGGAPFNVSYHLNKMGIDARMISSVGNDDLGRELLLKIKDWNLSSETIQIQEDYATSTVVAHIDEHNEAHYDILQNVAWDYIQPTEQGQNLVREADAMVFGSLVTRNEVSRNTLFEWVEESKFNVFDINLRAPYYDVKIIKDLLHKTHLAKFNKAELRLILDFFDRPYVDERDAVNFVQEQFGIRELIVSKGSKGALYAKDGEIFLYPAVSVEVCDTVGSGDSFLAGFLSQRLCTENVHETMIQAISLGAFITSKEGACPEYTYDEFLSFRKENTTSIPSFSS